MRQFLKGIVAATLVSAAGSMAHASSHREALAILNEPCADNTDTFAWVAPGAHDKLYLIMDFYPLHEPGQVFLQPIGVHAHGQDGNPQADIVALVRPEPARFAILLDDGIPVSRVFELVGMVRMDEGFQRGWEHGAAVVKEAGAIPLVTYNGSDSNGGARRVKPCTSN